MPDPDILIRPGGESRLSNFLLYQVVYAELVIQETFWPDSGGTTSPRRWPSTSAGNAGSGAHDQRVRDGRSGEDKPKPAVGARRIVIGLLLALVGLGAVAWPPAFSLIVLLVATGCIDEFAGLSARQGPALELPVAMGAVWAYVG